MHTSRQTSVTTSARWMLLRCLRKAFSRHETTPHWQHFTNSSTRPSNCKSSRRTSQLFQSLPLTTSSTASPSLPLWNHHFSCHQSRSNTITTFLCLYCSQVGATTCPGPVHLCVLTLYLVAHVLRRPCLFVIENKQDFC